MSISLKKLGLELRQDLEELTEKLIRSNHTTCDQIIKDSLPLERLEGSIKSLTNLSQEWLFLESFLTQDMTQLVDNKPNTSSPSVIYKATSSVSNQNLNLYPPTQKNIDSLSPQYSPVKKRVIPSSSSSLIHSHQLKSQTHSNNSSGDSFPESNDSENQTYSTINPHLSNNPSSEDYLLESNNSPNQSNSVINPHLSDNPSEDYFLESDHLQNQSDSVINPHLSNNASDDYFLESDNLQNQNNSLINSNVLNTSSGDYLLESNNSPNQSDSVIHPHLSNNASEDYFLKFYDSPNESVINPHLSNNPSEDYFLESNSLQNQSNSVINPNVSNNSAEDYFLESNDSLNQSNLTPNYNETTDYLLESNNPENQAYLTTNFSQETLQNTQLQGLNALANLINSFEEKALNLDNSSEGNFPLQRIHDQDSQLQPFSKNNSPPMINILQDNSQNDNHSSFDFHPPPEIDVDSIMEELTQQIIHDYYRYYGH